ncbi:MAG: FCD domain-containing protein [Acetobacteraceae bacterium]
MLAPGRKESSLVEHREIVAALLARDGAGAERAMRRHLAKVASVLGQLENAAAP